MSFFDLVGELRRGTPSPRKAVRALRTLGWVCLVGGVWNGGILHLVPAERLPFRPPEWLPWAALLGLGLLGAAFLAAARGIREGEAWGRALGQAAIVLLVAFSLGVGLVLLVPALGLFLDLTWGAAFAGIVLVVVSVQFVVPAFLGIRYLGRLPAEGAGERRDRFGPRGTAAALQARERQGAPAPAEEYREALLPFGPLGSFALLLAVPLTAGFAIAGAAGPQRVTWIIPAALILVFVLPTLYNFVPSRFQERRKVVASFTGGGSIFLFSGSWPFFRLLVYGDGLEVRVLLNRFFVPFDRMDELPQRVGFFSRGLLIRSEIPGVPSRIRFQGFGMKKIAGLTREMKHQAGAKVGG